MNRTIEEIKNELINTAKSTIYQNYSTYVHEVIYIPDVKYRNNANDAIVKKISFRNYVIDETELTKTLSTFSSTKKLKTLNDFVHLHTLKMIKENYFKTIFHFSCEVKNDKKIFEDVPCKKVFVSFNIIILTRELF
jgi:hypothetical protein